MMVVISSNFHLSRGTSGGFCYLPLSSLQSTFSGPLSILQISDERHVGEEILTDYARLAAPAGGRWM